MKKIFILLFTLFISITAFSQNDRFENNDRIQALKVAYITEELNLSAAEAQKFWPVFNAFEDEQQRLRKSAQDKRNDINYETISENEALKLLEEMVTLGKERIENYEQFIQDLKQVLPAKKIILLKKVEDEFKRKIFEEFKKRRKNRQQDRP